jgi:adenylate cyclase
MGTGGGHDGLVPGTSEQVEQSLRALLLARGATDEEIDAAIREDRIDLLAIDRLMVPSEHRHSSEQLFEATGLDPGVPARLWRALGFAEAETDAESFNDQDLEALRIVYGLISLRLASLETAVQLTRVMGSSMERLAEALVAASDVQGLGPRGEEGFLQAGLENRMTIAQQVAFASEVVFPSVERLILYAWRRHIQAAVRRRATLLRDDAGQDAHLPVLTVGFADMVGFTALSQQLSATDLAELVDRFEAVAHDTVVVGGGRVVKMIGDEVMFVTDHPYQAILIALALVDAYADDELLSDVRVGLATGNVLARDGDYFGSVVNRASRIVNIADAGTVLVSDEVADALADHPDVRCEPLKPRELKDIGRVQLFAATPSDAPAVPDSRRSGVRWRRMSDLRQELEHLRQRGEAMLTTIAPGRDEDAGRR